MGLFRAAIIFLIGNFSLSLMEKHLNEVNNIPVVGHIFGDKIKEFITKNKCMALLLILTIVEFIL